MTNIQYVKSNYERKAGDFYRTVDERCIDGLLEHFTPKGTCVDVCAPDGSGIVDTLNARGFHAIGIGDAFNLPFMDIYQSIITNPPYSRPLVDQIIERQIQRIQKGEFSIFFCLLRSNFDFAKSRNKIFKDCEYYQGQIKLQFRPWWTDDHSKGPIHNFVWHWWSMPGRSVRGGHPITLYSTGKP